MSQLKFDEIKKADFESYQVELKLAHERALQFEAWEKIALEKLSKATIKNTEIHEAHHQTFMQLRNCLQHVDAVQAHLNATILARDRDIFWRLANPLRKTVGLIPRPVITYSRKVLKLCYWMATPWKMKTRLQFMQNRKDVQMQHPTHAPDSNQQIDKDNIVLNASSRDLYERILKSMAKS